jgi:hypothetical protein
MNENRCWLLPLGSHRLAKWQDQMGLGLASSCIFFLTPTSTLHLQCAILLKDVVARISMSEQVFMDTNRAGTEHHSHVILRYGVGSE